MLIQGILGDSPVLPVTQGLVGGAGGGSCPAVATIPPLPACQGRNSDCWSVGQADVDCLGNALCCFDGCANACQGEGARPGIPRPQSNARGQQRKPPISNNSKDANGNQKSKGSANVGRNKQKTQKPSPAIQQAKFQPQSKQISNKRPKNKHNGNNGQPKQHKDSSTSFKQQANDGTPSVLGVGGGLLFPLVSQSDVGYSNNQEEGTGINKATRVPENPGVKPALPAQPSPTFTSPRQVQPAQHKTQQPSNFQQQVLISLNFI